MPRPSCPRCQRPLSLCLCDSIRPVPSRTRVLVLQHTQEARHALNTGRLAVLGLPNSELWVGETFPQLAATVATVPAAFVLFPGPEAVAPQPWDQSTNCSGLQGKADVSPLLIVPDGTWRKARKIVGANPVLHTLPRLCLTAGAPSRYRLRKTDEPNAVATIEAIVRTLSALEPDTDFTPLLAPFERLIDQQITAMGHETYERHHARNPF